MFKILKIETEEHLHKLLTKSKEVFQSSIQIVHYDAYFLECAVNLRGPLLTLDRGMQRVAQEIGITILE